MWYSRGAGRTALPVGVPRPRPLGLAPPPLVSIDSQHMLERISLRPLSDLSYHCSAAAPKNKRFFKNESLEDSKNISMKLEEGIRPPTPTHSVLPRKRPVLLRADFVLTKDPRPLYLKTPPSLFYHKVALRKDIWVLREDKIGS